MTYRPLLRWKRGEQSAVANLSPQLKRETLPLLTLTGHSYNPASGATVDAAFDARIAQDAERLRTAWAGHRISVDFDAIDPDAECEGGCQPIHRFFDGLAGEVDARPVLRATSDPRFIEAVAGFDVPPTIRLTPDDLAYPAIAGLIDSQLEACGAAPGDCDLVVDLGYRHRRPIDNHGAGCP